MEQSKIFYKIFNFIFPFADFLYILQQEEYDSFRLIRWLPRFFFRRNFQIRERLKYTKRVKVTLVFTVLLWLVALFGVLWFWRNIWLLLALVISIPLFVLVGNVVLSPYFELIKWRVRRKAQIKVASIKNLRIINVAGSYGKTTVKNFIYQLTQSSFRTQMIPGNINTPNGIADWVNQNLKSNTEILVAELDTYSKGEIARSSAVIPADIAVLTNVGDQHLERFGNVSKLKDALAEVHTTAKANAVFIDKPNGLSYKGKKIKTNDLSDSNKENLSFALKVAEVLDIPAKFVENRVKKLELPDRRQKLTQMYGYEAIDDSYNISFTTAKAGIVSAKAAAKKFGKKLLVLTAGIPELSRENKNKNRELGKILSEEADQVIVLGSMFADEVMSGGESRNMMKVPDLKYFLTKTSREYPKEKWFLLHQPELGDLYY